MPVAAMVDPTGNLTVHPPVAGLGVVPTPLTVTGRSLTLAHGTAARELAAVLSGLKSQISRQGRST